MNQPKRRLGVWGEQQAAAYLQQKGYQIVSANWRCPLGEIDLVARQDNTLVFVEVRTRRGVHTQPALESIGAHKQARLVHLAHAYLETQGLGEALWRIDVIGIALPPRGTPVIEHVENALDW